MSRPGRKRLAVDVPIEMHEELAIIAKRRNITITMLINKLIYKEIQRERKLE